MDRDLLDFAGVAWLDATTRDAQIRVRFGCSPVAYYGRLNALLSRPESAAYAPATVRRLRTLRDQQVARRTAAAVG